MQSGLVNGEPALSDTARPNYEPYARRRRLELARALPVAAVALLAAAQLGWRLTGSVDAADWLGAALVVALLVTVTLLSGGAVRLSRAALAGVLGLCALAAWAGLSLLWSPVPSLAKEEAQLLALYAGVLALPLLVVRGSSARVAALAALALVPAGTCVAVALELLGGGRPDALFDSGRLQHPVSYANAQAAFALIGLWPALTLAAARTLPLLLRVAAAGAAAVCLATWLATQSKGGGIGLAVSAVVIFALVPGRLRLAVPTVLAAVPTLLLARMLTEPYRAGDGELAAAAADVGRGILLAGGLTAAVAVVYVLVDRRLSLGPRALRALGAAAGTLVAVAAIAGGTLFVERFGTPDDAVREGWASFSEYRPASGGTHLATLGGSNRYDFWRVSLGGFAEEPVAGIGARGFGPLYLQEGRSHEMPARAHSLVFETLLELGVVGVLLLALALLPPLVLVARAARARRLTAAAALGGCVGFLTHASADWIWTFPAVGVLFFLLLGLGAADSEELVPARRLLPVAGTVAAVALVFFAAPWLSARLTEQALRAGAPDASSLSWAKRLDPVAVRPLYVEAALAPTAQERLEPLQETVRREPRSVAARYWLGVALLEAGRPDEAQTQLEAAVRLAPRNELALAALERARAG